MSDLHRTVLIGCARSAGVAVQELVTSGQGLPPQVEWLSLPCGSNIDELYILRAFESGAERVMVLTCYDGACRSADGPKWTAKRVQAVKAILKDVGIPEDRLDHRFIAPTMASDLRQWLHDRPEPAPIATDEAPA